MQYVGSNNRLASISLYQLDPVTTLVHHTRNFSELEHVNCSNPGRGCSKHDYYYITKHRGYVNIHIQVYIHTEIHDEIIINEILIYTDVVLSEEDCILNNTETLIQNTSILHDASGVES